MSPSIDEQLEEFRKVLDEGDTHLSSEEEKDAMVKGLKGQLELIEESTEKHRQLFNRLFARHVKRKNSS